MTAAQLAARILSNDIVVSNLTEEDKRLIRRNVKLGADENITYGHARTILERYVGPHLAHGQLPDHRLVAIYEELDFNDLKMEYDVAKASLPAIDITDRLAQARWDDFEKLCRELANHPWAKRQYKPGDEEQDRQRAINLFIQTAVPGYI